MALIAVLMLASGANCGPAWAEEAEPEPASKLEQIEVHAETLPPNTPVQDQAESLEELIDDSADTTLDRPAPPEATDPDLAPPEDWRDQAELPRFHEPGSCQQRPPDREKDMDAEAVDWAREQIEETVCGASLWFDGLFGDDRNLEAARGAYGRLETSYEYSEFYGGKERIRFRLRVDLPNLENRASVFIGRDNDDNVVRDRSEGFALRSEFPQIDDRDQFFAGFGYGLPSSRKFRSDVKLGVRSLSSPRAFVQWRAEYLAYVDDVSLLQFRLTPFYSTRDGLGVTPGVDFSRVLTPRLLLRWSNVGTHSDRTLGFDWRSAAIAVPRLRLATRACLRGLHTRRDRDRGEAARVRRAAGLPTTHRWRAPLPATAGWLQLAQRTRHPAGRRLPGGRGAGTAVWQRSGPSHRTARQHRRLVIATDCGR